MIALTVLLVGVLGLFVMFDSGLRSVARAGERTTAAALASSQMERFRAVSWESIGLDEAAVATAVAPYATDTAYRPAAGRAALPVCGAVTPCTSAVPVRTTAGADGRNYRVDTYVTWQTVAAGRDVKVVSIVVRDPVTPARTITRIASAFDGELPGEDVPVGPAPTPNTPPAVTTPANQTTARGSAVSLAITASDANGDLITYSAAGLPTGLDININSGLVTGTATASGTYSPTIDVFDGEATTSVSFTWTVTTPAPVNVSRGRAAMQSSTVSGRVASRAVDGNYSTSNGNKTETSNSSRPWWEVDLGSVRALGSMRIVGGNGCCASGSPNLLVLASDTPFISSNMDVNSAAADFRTTIAGTGYADVTFSSSVSARYVRLYLTGTSSLRLAEVDVLTP